MPSWLSQATSNLSTSISNRKKQPSATSRFNSFFSSPSGATRPPRPRPSGERMLHQSYSTNEPTSSTPVGARRTGKAVSTVAIDAKEAARPSRPPFSPIQTARGSSNTVYQNAGAATPRTVRFQLPQASPISPEPFAHTEARGPAYVTVTRSPSLHRRTPSPVPTGVPRSPAASSGWATHTYPYDYTYAPDHSSAEANVDFTAKASPAIYALRVGPFRLLRTLASGHFGTAYVAHDTGSGRVVCVRTVSKAKVARDEKIERGLHVEARCFKIIAASAAHDRAYLMEAHGILQDEDRILFVMPLMQCDLLQAMLAAPDDRVDPRLARRWVAQLALGIDALHRMGIIHRDIKPENVLLDGPNGDVRIADFNTALVVQAGRPLADGEVYSDAAVGSVPYIAWETARRKWYGKMVDWWALGCVMFDLLTGMLLFPDAAARKKYARWDKDLEGRSYLSAHGSLSEEEESVVAGLIDLHPCSRYQLRHLRHHTYFFDENRVNVFDALLLEPAANLQFVGRPVHPSLLDIAPDLVDEPLCYASARPTPRVRPSRSPAPSPSFDAHYGDGDGDGSSFKFSELGWVNERGIWRGSV